MVVTHLLSQYEALRDDLGLDRGLCGAYNSYAIKKAEDRDLFKAAMANIGLDLPRSGCVRSPQPTRRPARSSSGPPLSTLRSILRLKCDTWRPRRFAAPSAVRWIRHGSRRIPKLVD